jgi:hypothetical protein
MRERLARLTSNVLNPFLVSSGVIIVLAVKSGTGPADALKWASISLALSVLPVFTTVFCLVRRKKLDGIFVNPREQRTRIYILAFVLAVGGCIVLYFFKAPEVLLATFTAGLIIIVIFTGINLYWKISLHTAIMSGSVTIFTIIYGVPGAFTILLLLPVAWSRWRMKLHSVAQVAVAAMLSAATVTLVFWGFGMVGQ